MCELDSDRPSPAKVAAVGMMRLLWSNEFRDIDSSNSVDAPLPSPGSVENLKNVKGVTWSHGPPHKLNPGVHFELTEQLANMKLHRAFAYV